MNKEEEAIIAEQIWELGWFQAFLDNEDLIPDDIRGEWEKMQHIADKIIQPKVNRVLEKHPYSIFN